MSNSPEPTDKENFATYALLLEDTGEYALPVYMTLLGLIEEDTLAALQAIHHASQNSPHTTSEITALLIQCDWRYQIVGAAAILMGAVNEKTLTALWTAIDSGSWVSPQLAVTAFRCDPGFENKARRRIEAGCPIDTKRLAKLDWATRSSVAGPISFQVHSHKAIASLTAMCRYLPGSAIWLEPMLTGEPIGTAWESDSDDGARIAIHWHFKVEQALQAFSQAFAAMR